MLGILPPEIILTTLSFLPLRQLQRCRLVSKGWNHFIHLNESSIYHAAAILHSFVPVNASLDSKLSDVPWMTHVNSWKDLCINFYRMDRRWEGNGGAQHTIVTTPRETVWRFKIDGEQRTVITTHVDGGLKVTSIDEDAVLWSLPHSEVHRFAHCEYSDGFLVFTREGHALEVWRRARDARTSPRPLTARPDLRQRQALGRAWQSAISEAQDDRGAFVPWTTITPPNYVRALRLVHSTLLVASRSAQEAYLFDVSSGALKQTIPFENVHNPPVEVNYVELGPRHIFICTNDDVLVYPLDAGDSQTSFMFSDEELGFDDLWRTQAFRIDTSPLSLSADCGNHVTLAQCLWDQSLRSGLSDNRGFTAIHVSPCGSHFATIDQEGCLCIVRNFEKALRDNGSLLENTTILDMDQPITNLAFEDDKRIVVYVQERGIFLVPFVSESDAPVDTLTMQPHDFPRVLRARHVGLHDSDVDCSCLQLTRSELWYTWVQHTDPGDALMNSQLFRMDFSELPCA